MGHGQKDGQKVSGPNSRPGPDPDRLKIDGDWEQCMGEALDKPIPEKGIPDQPGKGSKPRKKKGPGKKPKPDKE